MSVQPVPYPDAKPIQVQGLPALGEGLERHLVALSAILDRLADRVVLFRYRDWVFVSFGLFGAIGAVLTTSLMGAILVGQGVAPGLFLGMALLGSAAVVGGSWLLGQAFDYRLLLEDPRKALRRPVFVSWGGVLGLALTLVLFASLSGQGLLTLLDALARSIFLGHAVGRVGPVEIDDVIADEEQRDADGAQLTLEVSAKGCAAADTTPRPPSCGMRKSSSRWPGIRHFERTTP